MARKRVERNISFDDVRKVYYVSMDLGKNSEGKRVKQYRTFPNLTSARTGLREFYADRDKLLHPPKQEQTLRQWLDYWMENIIRPNRAETTVYAYQKIIDNHLDPLLGAVPLSKLSPKQIQEYYQTMTRTEGLSSNTCSPPPCGWQCGRICSGSIPWSGWSRPAPSSTRPPIIPRRT